MIASELTRLELASQSPSHVRSPTTINAMTRATIVAARTAKPPCIYRADISAEIETGTVLRSWWALYSNKDSVKSSVCSTSLGALLRQRLDSGVTGIYCSRNSNAWRSSRLDRSISTDNDQYSKISTADTIIAGIHAGRHARWRLRRLVRTARHERTQATRSPRCSDESDSTTNLSACTGLSPPYST